MTWRESVGPAYISYGKWLDQNLEHLWSQEQLLENKCKHIWLISLCARLSIAAAYLKPSTKCRYSSEPGAWLIGICFDVRQVISVSSRKTPHHYKSMGGQRRSPRISALDASKEDHDKQQLIRTTTTAKRRFDDSSAFTPVSKLAKQVWKGRDSPQNAADDHSTDCVGYWRTGQTSIRENETHDDDGSGKASIMPTKHTLGLVLDTLQRRDTYEIFAEPVDPDEVEDYYDIIKEPMDFGTMRAKLHEGMYGNLEQFEHDVFLIPENAMHFNSSATIYFRQARALHELANKVFHALRTDPESFASEFSGARRRSMRKALSHPKEYSRFDVSSKGALLLHAPSTSSCQRASKKNPVDSFGNSRDGRLCDVADRRDSYRKSRSSLTDHQGNKTLLLVNPHDEFSYKDSLMSYVKDLGPTAQMVAKRKLLGEHELKNGWVGPVKQPQVANPVSLFRTFRDFAPAGGCNPFLNKTRNVIDLTEDHTNGRKTCTPTLGPTSTTTPATKGAKEKTDTCPTPSPAADTSTSRRSNRVVKKDGVSTRNNNIVASFRSSDDHARPVILALENSHPNMNAAAEYKSRNKKSSVMTTHMPPPPPSVSQFTFDLPFLKARLHQMNVPSSSSTSLEKGVDRGHNYTRQLSGSVPIFKPFPYKHQSNPS